MKRIVAIAMFAFSANAAAQDPKPGRPDGIGANTPRKPMATESFARCLIAPELIMELQSEIGLEDSQRARIIDEMSRAQATFTKLQWEMAAAQQLITRALARSTVDESVLKDFDAMLALENELKRTQLTLLIRVKNALTPQQQDRLTVARTISAMREMTANLRELTLKLDGKEIPPKGSKPAGTGECSQ